MASSSATSTTDALERDAQQFNLNSISINDSSGNLDCLEPSFMYTQLIKEALIKIPYDETAKTALANFWQKLYGKSKERMEIINEFERNYHLHTPIWWYNCESFIAQTLNRALQILDVDIIMKMGFFLRDVHQQIKELHSQTGHQQDLFIVYRGQSMSNADLNTMKKNKGGLLACNGFLLTSKNEKVALQLARDALQNPESVGILFQMTIDPSISTVPFAVLDNVTYNEKPIEEILFSMHTVFQIGETKPIDDRLWRVELTLTSDSADPQLKELTERLRQETQGSTGWDQLGKLLTNIGHFDQADKIYQRLLQETPKGDEKELSSTYYQLGDVKQMQGDYQEALDSYKKALEIEQNSLPSNHPSLATSYSKIGEVHTNMGDCSAALEFYQKALEIEQNSLPPNHPSLATSYSNIGKMHDNMGEYTKALEFYQKALEIGRNSLPPNHPDLATTYSNIGMVHDNMGDYSKALEFCQKALEIEQNALPPNHPSLATSYSNIGKMHDNMGEYTKALSFYERALEIGRNTLPENHPLLRLYRQQLVEVQKKI